MRRPHRGIVTETNSKNRWEPDLPATFGRTVRHKPKVLVVEDMEAVLGMYLRVLEDAGYAPTGVMSNAEAFAVLETGEDFDAAVLDFSLPDGDALDILPRLMDRNPLTKAVIVTGQDDGEVPAQVMNAGAHGYIEKPIETSTLLSALSATVRATHAWRVALNQVRFDDAPPIGSDAVESYRSSPVAIDLQHMLERLRFVAGLTPVQTITAWRLLWGDPDQRIAELIGCTKRTVKYHVSEVLSRTGARSRSDLLRVLLEDAGHEDPWKARAPMKSKGRKKKPKSSSKPPTGPSEERPPSSPIG